MKISEMNREELAGRLILSVLNAEDSKERLLNFPHKIKGDFALVSQLCLGDRNIEGQYTSCITVTNDILNNWGITKDEMFDMAATNSRRMFPVLVEPIENLVGGMSEGEKSLFKADGINLPNCYVITNKQFYNGAAAMFYEPDVFDRLAARLKTDNLYLLPSSTNHIFCVPVSNLMQAEEYTEVFSQFVSEAPEKRLADKVYTYDSLSKMISCDGITFSPYVTDSAQAQGLDAVKNTVHR